MVVTTIAQQARDLDELKSAEIEKDSVMFSFTFLNDIGSISTPVISGTSQAIGSAFVLDHTTLSVMDTVTPQPYLDGTLGAASGGALLEV